jgi:palmitoyltransferase ZDHHC9/14/18/palmitoyltransferase
MENNSDIKKEIKISKTEEEDKEKIKIEKKNSYSKIANISHLENEQNENDIEIEVDNDIFAYYSQENDKENELTQSQLERLNKIREEAQIRSEKYSELSSNNLITGNKNNSGKTNEISNTINASNNDTIDTMSNLSHNFINNEYEENQNNEINPNLERVYNQIHPFLFINNEPIILIGPDILYYIIILSISSFLSIIFYSLKNKPIIVMKILFILGYLFYSITYTLLMILNPGIPTNKNNIDLDELRKNYNQCNACNCIFYKNNDYITFHCHECNICVEDFDHHCTFATKCIGRKNKILFKLWLFSIPFYIIIIFFYFIL